MHRIFAFALAASLAATTAASTEEVSIPSGFVRLHQVAPTILQDMRYAGTFNFVGTRVPGYQAPQCILWRPAAEALARAQKRLIADGFSLKVYDCYRPALAVRAFFAWSRSPGDDRMRAIFYPGLDKSRLFSLGYISLRSRHSLGIAVDVGLARTNDAKLPPPTTAGACDGPFEERAKESSLDFGTAFDCFSPLSSTAHTSISREARANRDRLVHALTAEGFKNYSREWWHFEFSIEPLPKVPYDFLVR
jgi:D-alanyl-D-alanine dipeptidase